MAQHAKHGTPEQTRRAKKNLKARRKRLARQRRQAQKLERKRSGRRERRAGTDRGERRRSPLKAVLVTVLVLVALPVAGAAAWAANPAFAEPAIAALQPAFDHAGKAVNQVLAIGGFGPVFNADDSSDEGSAAESTVQSPATTATTAADTAAAGSASGTGAADDAPAVSDKAATDTASAADGTDPEGPGSSASGAANGDAGKGQSSASSSGSASEQGKTQADPNAGAQCYIVAQCQGVDIYSPIMQKDITGMLFHQASYEWAQVMTTQLPEADMAKINDGTQRLHANNAQTEGTWADVEIAHLYRETDATPMDTSIDCGAAAGTTVYAPVTGEVIAVTDYDLYDEVPDVRIHIRPDANADLDVVLLHQTDPQVKAGDHVEAGVTPISSVRDIACSLTDVQLGFYTEGDDPGNHSHVQVNDLNSQAYLDKYFGGKRPDK